MKYIFIALIFCACNISTNNNSRKISTEVLDTIKTAPKSHATPVLFETVFIKGTSQEVNGKILHLYGVTIGNLKIPTGEIIACDPLHIDEYGIPFTRVFPTGEFPVQLSIVKFNDVETIAFARIYFNDEPVEKWELALLKGQEPLPVGVEKFHGFGVDGGVGIYIDKAAIKKLDIKGLTSIEAPMYKEMENHYRNNWRYTIYKFDSHNLAAFTTGAGDGRYATYIGYDANGKPCRLLTDFNLFDWRNK